MDLASLCFNIQKELEYGWTLADDFHAEEALPGPKNKRKKKNLDEDTVLECEKKEETRASY